MSYLFFFLELFFLFLFSRDLSRFLSQLFYSVLKSQKITIYLVAILFFPGVVIHEISHWLMAQILFVPTGKVEFLPVLRGTELKLGSVQVAVTDPFRRALIGVAPFLVGTTLLLFLLYFYNSLFLPETAKVWIVGYCLFEIGNTMFSSRKDLEGTIELVAALAVVGVIFYLFGLRVPESVIAALQTGSLYEMIQTADKLLLYPLAIDGVMLVIIAVLLKLLR